ncbi:hypothetical protein MMC17_006107 [Xylographa soralifera]|nr:hypothetical protein [Xylographa soralifera]
MADLITKVVFFNNEFPTDDLQDLFRRLQRYSKDKRFLCLATFLQECVTVLKEESQKLPQLHRDLLPHFSTISALANLEDYRHGPLGGALESTLLCVLEIGMFIAYHEAHNLQFFLPESSTTLSGLSIGLLAAAAVSVSTSLTELALTGTESVRVAFRLGTHVDGISQSLEPRELEGPLSSWAYVVTGVEAKVVQTELDQFNAENSNPELTKVFISAADKNSTSVTGPPSRLKHAFRYSQVLRYSKHLPLPVYSGLCHAAHLYNEGDVNSIVNGSEPKCSRSCRVQIPLLSMQTGDRFPAEDAGRLFEQICTEILTGTIYLDKLTNGIISSISSSGRPQCQVLMFRTSIISNSILSAIELDVPQVHIAQQDLIGWSTDDLDTRIPRSSKESKLAVVGMSCRMPGGANNTELFWKLMVEGRDTHTRVPIDRFDLSTHYDPTGKTENATETPFGNFIDKPGMFDAAFFNMSPREAEQTDPTHRLALVTAYEALEMAGYAPNRTPSENLKRIGTYYGQASDDWREVNGGQNIGTHAVPGGERAFANGRINYFFKFAGPSFNIDTACSSGLAAVNAACSALWAGDADTVLAGGLSVITNPDNYAMLCKGHFLSKTGQCKVWDKSADGYCRSDGIGSIVIKRLEDAEADNDNIIATILSGATNHSAEAISITHPHAGAQKENYKQILHRAGINPLDISYIELHGTGTQAGDSVESESVMDIFAPLTPRRRGDQQLYLGAVKSNIGHSEAAAGIASMIKALLVYQKNEIPRHVGFKTEINPLISKDLEKRRVCLNLENIPRPKLQGKKRYTIVNSFGAHGGNTTLLLEDAPEKLIIGNDPRSSYPITISAKSKASLKGNIEGLVSYLNKHPNTDLGDLSYTTCARRIHHNIRIGTSVSSIAQLKKFLALSVESSGNVRPVPIVIPTIAFTFTGQGAFYGGISSQLFNHFPFYREQVLQLDYFVQRFGFPSVVPSIEGTIGDEPSPLITQLTIVVVEIALSRFWALLGIKPSVVIGHSLGEYAALVVAGVLSAADAIYLAGKRAELILATCDVGSQVMMAVRASVEVIEKVVSGNNSYEVSCMNGKNDTVISGVRKDIEAIGELLERNGVNCSQLKIPFAFHTAQMDPMLEPFERLAKHVSFKVPCVPIISPLFSTCIFDGKTLNSRYLCRASREPVNFVDALKAAQDLGIVDEKTVWVDIGPHPVSGNFVRSHVPSAKVLSSLRKNEDNFATIANSLSVLHCEGLAIIWNEYFRPYEKAHNLLALETYKWNEKDYWIPYIGTWTLDKAHTKENPDRKSALETLSSNGSSLRTSSIHQITSEELENSTSALTAISDLMCPDLFAAVYGHKMNGNGVATSSIWADMALTVGEYLYRRVVAKAKDVHMDVANMEVLHAQVAQRDTSSSQMLQVEARMDLSTQATMIRWYNVSNSGIRADDSFASATVRYEDHAIWQMEWERVTHLVKGRIDMLSQMAADGSANKLSKNMAYTLFKNVVDYSDKYRGMRSVVLHDYEAYADITLVPERHGTWHTPPHWIDSVCHLAGLVMNGSDASNTQDFFYVTPGWDNFRLAEPLKPGVSYRSYVRMFPFAGEANMHAGDVYILRDNAIIGMMRQMKFRRVPRVLMDQFFSPSDAKSKKSASASESTSAPALSKSVLSAPTLLPKMQKPTTTISAACEPTPQLKALVPAPEAPSPTPTAEDDGVVPECMRLITQETGLDLSELTDDASFVALGVDSLMSLVLSEKFRSALQLEVKSSVFLEYRNIGEFKKYLEQYA